jgi:hypothetical protein
MGEGPCGWAGGGVRLFAIIIALFFIALELNTIGTGVGSIAASLSVRAS